MELKGRVALVTGGAGGIGGAVVRSLAKGGVGGIAIHYRKSSKEAYDLAAEMERAGVKAQAIEADIQSDRQVRSMMEEIQARFGRLDILVNNAGITRWVNLSDLDGLTDEIWDEILDVNLKGAFRCARAAAPMLAEHQGMIVNVSSVSGVLAPSTMSSLAYGAAKAALIYLTKGLAVALAPNVRVNCVAPAFTDTPWMSEHFGANYPQAIAKAAASFPLQRIATADEVAGAIVGLITGGDFVTGQTLIVDGGLTLS
ncbi:MAG TPA: SDR family oxidoreductase [Candidatus Binatia bacterium]|nr:SDR family oxidoreductase [Candidatus Binatia bacterium]HXV83435.1 SDR family oxidoreductase [Candidatus Binatia bacterium]